MDSSRKSIRDVFHLRILQTTDLHGNAYPFDYLYDRYSPDTGLIKLAGLIEQARKTSKNSLTFDTGDFLFGTLIGDLAASAQRTASNPIIAAMNTIGYDAVTLGNHDFDFGLSKMRDALKDADFPTLCSNITTNSDFTFSKGSILVEKVISSESGSELAVKIGIVGSLPPLTQIWCSHGTDGECAVLPVLPALRAEVDKLKSQGADLVIALAHTGIASKNGFGSDENVALEIAQLDGIDIILCGHQHRLFPGPDFQNIENVDAKKALLFGKPAMMPGAYGQYVGQMDLKLAYNNGLWSIEGSDTKLLRNPNRTRPFPRSQAQREISRKLVPHHQLSRRYANEVIGSSNLALQNYFFSLTPDPVSQLVSNAKRWYFKDQLKGTTFAKLPILTAVSAFRTNSVDGFSRNTDIPSGPILRRHLTDIYPYPNQLCALLVSGQQVIDWLNHAAKYFNDVQPKSCGASLVRPEVPGFHFDVIQGLHYEIDLSKPIGQRIRNATYRGQKVKSGDQFILATNSYRALGGGGYNTDQAAKVVHHSDDYAVKILENYVRAHLGVNPKPKSSWSFTPIAGASAILETLGDAHSYTETVAIAGLSAPTVRPDGKLQFCLNLDTPCTVDA